MGREGAERETLGHTRLFELQMRSLHANMPSPIKGDIIHHILSSVLRCNRQL